MFHNFLQKILLRKGDEEGERKGRERGKKIRTSMTNPGTYWSISAKTYQVCQKSKQKKEKDEGERGIECIR